MSGVFFTTTEDGEEVRLQGAERSYLGSLYCSICQGLAPDTNDLRPYYREGRADLADPFTNIDLSWSWWHAATPGYGTFRLFEHDFSRWHVALNTGIVVGGDAIRLACYIDASCEVHGWIAEGDRKWMADIIRHARHEGIYRDMPVKVGNWEDVVELLEGDAPGDIVLSYSVCDIWQPGDEMPIEGKRICPDRLEMGFGPKGADRVASIFDLRREIGVESWGGQGYELSAPDKEVHG